MRFVRTVAPATPGLTFPQVEQLLGAVNSDLATASAKLQSKRNSLRQTAADLTEAADAEQEVAGITYNEGIAKVTEIYNTAMAAADRKKDGATAATQNADGIASLLAALPSQPSAQPEPTNPVNV